MLEGSERPLAVKYAEDQHKKKERKQDGVRGQGMSGRVDGGYGRKGAPQSASPNPAMPGYSRQSSFIAPGLAYNPTSGATLSAYDWYSQVSVRCCGRRRFARRQTVLMSECVFAPNRLRRWATS